MAASRAFNSSPRLNGHADEVVHLLGERELLLGNSISR
jgi:hypothetical protein